jgi:protein-L-isoaspartate O-methyltransferase
LDLEAARTAMIDSQVRPNDVTDRRLISAMTTVAREAFVPASRRAVAYAELPIETATGRWMGIQNAVGNVAGMTAPVVTGYLVATTGNYTAASLVSGVVALCVGAIGEQQEHFDTLQRFGRYPYRNAALGRTSTPEELAYLASRR